MSIEINLNNFFNHFLKKDHKQIFDKYLKICNDVSAKLKSEIEARDFKDSNREVSPLRESKDSFLIDNTSKSVEETLEVIEELINEIY